VRKKERSGGKQKAEWKRQVRRSYLSLFQIIRNVKGIIDYFLDYGRVSVKKGVVIRPSANSFIHSMVQNL
jgi:hypothetical protein